VRSVTVLALGLAAAVGLVACATPSAPNTRQARMTGQFDYLCGTEPATLTFDNAAGTATLQFRGEASVMGRQPTSSGWLYQNPTTTVLGNERVMQISGPMGTINCTSK
jgi:hypothetical protein